MSQKLATWVMNDPLGIMIQTKSHINDVAKYTNLIHFCIVVR